ncbi:MAG: glycosyltransferase [Planctomycetota bacterium]
MRVLMLGWEFPPFISGGLGTACYGLTRALDALGHDVLFVLPKAVDRSMSSHVRLMAPNGDEGDDMPDLVRLPSGQYVPEGAKQFAMEEFERVRFLGIPSSVTSPYNDQTGNLDIAEIRSLLQRSREEVQALRDAGVWVPDELESLLGGAGGDADTGAPGADYSGDVVAASQKYARLVVRLCRHAEFDVIHAHDWMTYPAGMALAAVTGKPLVTHIHSTEFDRSGEHVNQPVYDIERRGMHAAVRVIAVSMFTKGICAARYAVPKHKVAVIYNGIEKKNGTEHPEVFGGSRIEAKDKVVLFLGRITMQKGPEYFVQAAKRVLEKQPNVKFLVAGSGDMARRMIEQAAEMGIGHKVLFTGFLHGADVQRIYRMADCYVMPSVSEPFGIAPLEAMANGTPAIISKQSGVSEVLQNVLKVDFWDIDEMANKILAVLRHPPLSQTLREHGTMEIRELTWRGAAEKCVEVYKEAQQSIPAVPIG